MNDTTVNPYYQISLIKKFSSSIGKLGSRIVTPLSNALESTKNTYQRINQSIVGRYLINSVQENILECAGALVFATLGNWWLGNTMEGLGSHIGHLTGMVTSIGVGILVIKHSYPSIMQKKHQSEVAKIGASTLLGATTTVAAGMVLSSIGSKVGGVVGRAVGSFIGAQVGSILGGFVAIKINGSEEVLINTQEPLNSYVVKTLQSNSVNGFLSHFWQFNPLVQAVQDQAVGSLAYHSLTVIKPTLEAMYEGRLLDELFTQSFEITPDEKHIIQEKIKNAYENPANRQAILNLAMTHGFQQDIITPFLNQDLRALFQTEVIVDERQFQDIMMQSFKKYLQFVLRNPEIQRAYHSLSAAFIAWQPDQEALVDSIPFKKAKEHLISVLEEQVNQHIKDRSLQLEWNKVINMIDKDEGKKWIDQILDIGEIRQTLNEKKVYDLVDCLLIRLENFEKKLFAYSLTNENIKTFVKEVVVIQLNSFHLFSILEETKFKKENQSSKTIKNSKTVRKNYQLLGQLLASYYCLGSDKRLPIGMSFISKQMVNSVQLLFDQQIQTAKLKEVTLSHFIDLNSL